MKSLLKRIAIKLTSTKTWVALWAMFLVTWIVITKQEAFNYLAFALVVLIGCFLGVNLTQKLIKHGDNNEVC